MSEPAADSSCGASRLFGVIATVVAIVALLAPTSRAQCAQARSFGGFPGGKTGSQILIDATAFENAGNEMAQFWITGTPANGSGVGAAGSCDSQGPAPVGWWQQVGTSTNRAIRGYVAQPGCDLPACPLPGQSLTFLIEEMTADGSGAGFIMYTTDDTPAGLRWYDHARTDPDAAPGTSVTHVMESLPKVIFTGSAGIPPNITVSANYADVESGTHGVQEPGNTPLPASVQVESYDVLWAHGGDPGRDRGLWTLLKQIAYTDAPIVGDVVEVPCIDEDPVYLAIGLTFDGGVESSFVGRASAPIHCGLVHGPAPAGRVPPSLLIGKAGTTGEIELDWAESCGTNDFYYAVFEGSVGGVFDTHVHRTCNTNGWTEWTLLPSPESSYYLVVPIAAIVGGVPSDPKVPLLPVEGSYGHSSSGERSQGIQACREQLIGSCAAPD